MVVTEKDLEKIKADCEEMQFVSDDEVETIVKEYETRHFVPVAVVNGGLQVTAACDCPTFGGPPGKSSC